MRQNMKFVKDSVRGIVKSFDFALRGLRFCILNERNMRIHLVALSIVIYFAAIYGLTTDEWAILLIASVLVLVCEMINTAIEALVNLGTSAYDNVARVAKDVAAGAVFLTAVMALAVGGFLFIRPERLAVLAETLYHQPALFLPFVLLLIAGPFFIIFGSKLKRQK